MKRLALPCLALLLAGCTTTGAQERAIADRDTSWIVGSWLPLEDGEPRHPGGCASGLPITYLPDGTYALFEEVGTWRLEDDLLVETATAITEAGDPAEAAIGRPFTSRIERFGPDEIRKTFSQGERITLLRCPPA